VPATLSRVVVTGGAGFLGSHIVDALLARGSAVVCLDNLITGRAEHVAHLIGRPGFDLVQQDVSRPFDVDGPVDAVLHFASLASPADYTRFPIETLHVGTMGTWLSLELALDKGATYLLASTSEVYGDPAVHPQPESYWGNVNPVGPRSVYDESKRAAEAYVMAYHNAKGLDTRIVRIFNTFGPRMRKDDGRAVPQFMTQALAGQPITVYGDGSQTRSLCYVDDLVDGVLRVLDSDYTLPVNIGNPHETTVLDLAELIRRVCNSQSAIGYEALPVDDPKRRCPDITTAVSVLGWQPAVALEQGLRLTAAWWKTQQGRGIDVA
jgi:nucleoside-diphosphate-sugar epimerase